MAGAPLAPTSSVDFHDLLGSDSDLLLGELASCLPAFDEGSGQQPGTPPQPQPPSPQASEPSSPPQEPLPPQDALEKLNDKKRQRLESNRRSAQELRKRKREHVKALEGQCADLQARATQLQAQLSALTAENNLLRQENGFLRGLRSQGPGAAPARRARGGGSRGAALACSLMAVLGLAYHTSNDVPQQQVQLLGVAETGTSRRALSEAASMGPPLALPDAQLVAQTDATVAAPAETLPSADVRQALKPFVVQQAAGSTLDWDALAAEPFLEAGVERLLIIPHQLPSLTSPSDLSDYALALDKLDQVPLPPADWAPAEGDEASVARITVEDPYILGGPSRTVEVAEQPPYLGGPPLGQEEALDGASRLFQGMTLQDKRALMQFLADATGRETPVWAAEDSPSLSILMPGDESTDVVQLPCGPPRRWTLTA